MISKIHLMLLLFYSHIDFDIKNTDEEYGHEYKYEIIYYTNKFKNFPRSLEVRFYNEIRNSKKFIIHYFTHPRTNEKQLYINYDRKN